MLTIGEAAGSIERALAGVGSRRALRDDGRGRRARGRAGPARRHRAALAGLRLLRPVRATSKSAESTSPSSRELASRSRSVSRSRIPTSRGSGIDDRLRRLMARKLASDKVLFVALVALSLFGCVMIYSASAVSAARDARQPLPVPHQADRGARRSAGWPPSSCTGPTIGVFARPWVVYGAYGVALLLCVFALFRPPINSARRWIPLGPVDAPALGAPEGGARAAARATSSRARRRAPAQIPRRRSCPRARLLTGLAAGVVVLRAGSGHRRLLRDALRGRCCGSPACGRALPVRRWRAMRSAPGGAAALGRLPAGAAPLLPPPRGGPAGRRFPGHPVADRGRRRRLLRQRPRRQPAEALLPARIPHTDFIFAIVGEELGFVGAVGVVVCFGVVAWRGLRAARRAPDAFAALSRRGRDRDDRRAGGDQRVASCWRSMPTKGIPLPFVSYGGSSLVASWIAGGSDPEHLAARSRGGS